MISVDMTNTINTSSTFDQENDEMASGTTSIQKGEDDEDIPAIDTTTATTSTQLQGAITRARARQLNPQAWLAKIVMHEACDYLRLEGFHIRQVVPEPASNGRPSCL